MLGILDEFAVDGMDPASESDLEPLNEGLNDCEEVRLSRPSPALVTLPGRLSDFGRLVALPISLFGSDLWRRKRCRQEGKMMIILSENDSNVSTSIFTYVGVKLQVCFGG